MYWIDRSALNVPTGTFWMLVKNGRTPDDKVAMPGGMSSMLASGVVPSTERSAETRDATELLVKATSTSEVGSWYGTAPPALMVRSKNVAVDAPDATLMLWIGLKFGGVV